MIMAGSTRRKPVPPSKAISGYTPLEYSFVSDVHGEENVWVHHGRRGDWMCLYGLSRSLYLVSRLDKLFTPKVLIQEWSDFQDYLTGKIPS